MTYDLLKAKYYRELHIAYICTTINGNALRAWFTINREPRVNNCRCWNRTVDCGFRLSLSIVFELHSHPFRLKVSYSATWFTGGRWWVGCYIWYSDERTGRAAALLYNGPLLCSFNVLINGLATL